MANVEKASPLAHDALIVRGTLGMAYALERGLRLKASTEFWRFSSKDDTGRQIELGFHLGAVGTF